MPTMDPSLFSVLKQQLPDLSDQDVVLAHQTIANRLKAQGQDFDALPIPQQAQLYKSVISELKTAQSNVDPNVQSVSIVGQRPVETPDQEIQKMPAAPQAPNERIRPLFRFGCHP